jgi:hypothetical protein
LIVDLGIGKSTDSVWPGLGFCLAPVLSMADNEKCGMKSGIGLREHWEVVIFPTALSKSTSYELNIERIVERRKSVIFLARRIARSRN